MKTKTLHLGFGAVATLLLLGAALPAPVILRPAVSYPIGRLPIGMVAVDFDGDSMTDVVATTAYGRDIRFLRNVGAKGFVDGGSFDLPPGAFAGKMVASDFNGDDSTDIAIALPNVGRVMILLMNAHEAEFTYGQFNVGLNPGGMDAGDLDDDGDMDLVVANTGSNTVSLLFNNGEGSFILAKSRIVTGSEPRHVALADLDQDGDLDMVVSNYGEEFISLYLNNGEGGIAAWQTFATTSHPDALIVRDLNNDGFMDIAVTGFDRSARGTISVFSAGRNGFAGPMAFSTFGLGTSGLACADLDRDGWLDLIAADQMSNTLTVLMGGGKQAFQAAAMYKTAYGPDDVLAFNIDSDGDEDLVVLNSRSDCLSIIMNDFPRSGPMPWPK